MVDMILFLIGARGEVDLEKESEPFLILSLGLKKK